MTSPAVAPDHAFALAEAIPHLAWVALPDGTGVYNNRRWLDYTGLTLAQSTGCGWQAAVHPDDLRLAADAWAAAAAAVAEYEVEFRLRRHDGACRWHLARALPQKDEAGRVVRWVGTLTDIHDRRLLEQAVRASGARFRAVVERSYDAFVFLRPDRVVTYISPGVERFLGAPPEAFLGEDAWGWVHPDDRAGLTAAFADLLSRDGGSATVEYRFRHAALGWRWLEATATNLLADPDVGAVVANFHDVTDRKRAADELAAWRARYAAAVEASGQLLYEWDTATDACLWSGPADRILGFAPAEMPTDLAGWSALVHADDRAAFDAEAARVAATGEPFRMEYRVRRKDGRYVTVDDRGHFVRDGAATRMVGLVADVTDRRRAEAVQARLAAIVDTSDDAIIGLTPAGVVETWNPGAERLYGYAAAEAVGRSVTFLLPPDHAHELPDQTGRLARGEHVPPFETVRLRKDGTRVDVSLRLSPQRDGAGRLSGYSAIARDITDRRRLEAQLRQAAKMEAVGRLAGGVAHDFNNLLTVINGYADVLLGALPAHDPGRDMAAEVRRAGERAAGLTRQLLAFGRQQMLQRKVLDLNAVVADLAGMLRRVIGEDVDLALHPGAGLWKVEADPGQVGQVLMNLCVNARDAMPTGGRLTVRTRNAALGPGLAQDGAEVAAGRYVELAVADTGWGMPAGVLAHIFEPFFTTKPVGEGTGLGLATVYGVVKQSGGHVEVESRVGAGTTFRVYLPAAAEAPAGPGERPAGAGAPARGTEAVLLVEDDPGVRALAALVLRRAGYTVTEAGSGEQAVAAAAGRGFDLLVTDVVMPGVGGRELADRLRADRPGLRVLYTSGYTADAVVRHGVEQDAVDFLQKPFTPAALAAKVREVLDAGP